MSPQLRPVGGRGHSWIRAKSVDYFRVLLLLLLMLLLLLLLKIVFKICKKSILCIMKWRLYGFDGDIFFSLTAFVSFSRGSLKLLSIDI